MQIASASAGWQEAKKEIDYSVAPLLPPQMKVLKRV
jgi:hypothetical protein